VKLGKAKVTINGMAKGAGMIMPDMATMLSFVFTDAPLSAAVLQSLLKSGRRGHLQPVTIRQATHRRRHAARRSRPGAAAANGAPKITRASDLRLKAFAKAFYEVLANLSEQVARDGEGARKLVEVVVEGATTKASARKIAMSIANSAGEDGDRGRGRQLGPRGDGDRQAGEPANRDKISISFNGIRVAKSGARDPSYNEQEVSEAMKAQRSRSR
jgi:glutamate N-acetyltransferase/amino-acid N-acetyltransferase